MAHDYQDINGALVSVADSGLQYGCKPFVGAKKTPIYYRIIDLNDCKMTTEKLYINGSLSQVWQLFEDWNGDNTIMYCPVARLIVEAEMAQEIMGGH